MAQCRWLCFIFKFRKDFNFRVLLLIKALSKKFNNLEIAALSNYIEFYLQQLSYLNKSLFIVLLDNY